MMQQKYINSDNKDLKHMIQHRFTIFDTKKDIQPMIQEISTTYDTTKIYKYDAEKKLQPLI